jgi:hypothetical protein
MATAKPHGFRRFLPEAMALLSGVALGLLVMFNLAHGEDIWLTRLATLVAWCF